VATVFHAAAPVAAMLERESVNALIVTSPADHVPLPLRLGHLLSERCTIQRA
jgi:hypothetical protein